MAFSNFPRKPRSGSVVPATVGKLASSGPSETRLKSLLDAAAQERKQSTVVSEVQAESEGHVQDTDANLPPEFEPSPPVSPGVAQAAAAAAAAVAAKAECTTWISGEPCSSMNNNNGSSSRSEGSVLSLSEEEQVDSTYVAKKRATARKHFPYGRSEKRCKVDEEIVYERALSHLAAQFGARHPEVGKALLQMARFHYARQQHEKAEGYLIRSWEVFKLGIDHSRNVDEVFVSFISLCEEFNVTAEGLKGLKQEMQQISPSSSNPRGMLEWNKTL